MRKITFLVSLLVAISMLMAACAPAATPAPAAPATAAPAAPKVTLTIESWRNDDIKIWQDTIIPAFEKANPDKKKEKILLMHALVL